MVLFQCSLLLRLISGRAVVGAHRIPSKLAMTTSTKSEYERAVCALNGLQSNAATIQKSREERSAKAHLNLFRTRVYLQNLGVTIEDLDSLNTIHVAGTKGKGSTCAFSEAILRNHGYKTGFYSSPHLISVTERIRVNGNPISKEAFAKYFWEVYGSIQQSLEEGETMPPYFLFLTVMAFYVFVKEQVEAAVIEVGIGGLWDCTNILRKPVATGIATLGIDHTGLLGSTLTDIAAQKAGILKPGVPAFTVPQQESAMRVLRDRAQVINCPLFLSPAVESYEKMISLGVKVQNVNASLALQLTREWLKRKHHLGHSLDALDQSIPLNGGHASYDEDSLFYPLPLANTFPVDSKTIDALEHCVWPGRFQVLKKGKMTYYLDGAHTQQSMKHCARWFVDLSERHKVALKSPVLRILYFNCTGERKAENLLDPLVDGQFDLVIFSPNKVQEVKDASSDNSNFMVEPEKEIEQCVMNREIWRHLLGSLHENELSCSAVCYSLPKPNGKKSGIDNTLQFHSISDAFHFISSPKSFDRDHAGLDVNPELIALVQDAHHIQVLVTGSLHLIGGVLSLLQEE